MPASSDKKMAKSLPDLEKYADLGCMFDRARVKKELQVDSSPETSTKAAPHSAASGAPSVGSHETGASMPVDEKPVAEKKTVAAELNEGKQSC